MTPNCIRFLLVFGWLFFLSIMPKPKPKHKRKRKRNFEKGTATKNRKKKRKNTDEKEEETRTLDREIDKILTKYEKEEKRSKRSRDVKKDVLPTDSLYVQSGYVSDDDCDRIEKANAREKDTRDFIPKFCIRD